MNKTESINLPAKLKCQFCGHKGSDVEFVYLHSVPVFQCKDRIVCDQRWDRKYEIERESLLRLLQEHEKDG